MILCDSEVILSCLGAETHTLPHLNKQPQKKKKKRREILKQFSALSTSLCARKRDHVYIVYHKLYYRSLLTRLCFSFHCTTQTNAGPAHPDGNFQCRQRRFNRGFLNSTPLPDSGIIPVRDVLSVIVGEMPHNNSLCMLYLERNLRAAQSVHLCIRPKVGL